MCYGHRVHVHAGTTILADNPNTEMKFSNEVQSDAHRIIRSNVHVNIVGDCQKRPHYVSTDEALQHTNCILDGRWISGTYYMYIIWTKIKYP